QILANEHVTEQPACALGDDDAVWGRHALQPIGHVGRFSDGGRSFTEGVAHDDQAGCNSDPHSQHLAAGKQELTKLRHESQASPPGSFSIVLVGLGIAKISKESITYETSDIP